MRDIFGISYNDQSPPGRMDNLGPANVAAQTIVNIQHQDPKKETIGLA